MTVKKKLEEYLLRTTTGGETVPESLITPDNFFKKNFNTKHPQSSAFGIGMSKEGIELYLRTVEILEDLGQMGVLCDTKHAVKKFNALIQKYYYLDK